MKTEKSWWKGYKVGKVEINGTNHRAEALVVKKGMRTFAEKRMKELGWKPERIK